jgi:hypothetical protein
MRKLENLLMALVGLIIKISFIIYSAVANVIFLVALLLSSAGLYLRPVLHEHWWYPTPLFLLGLSLLYALLRPGPPKDNPNRRYPGLFGPINKCADAFIAWIGRIKYFCLPISLVEDPGSYRITGAEIRDLIDGGLKPGDILLRGYDGYLDGIMIGLTGGGKGLGKYFSHAALYAGELNDTTDKSIVARRLETQQDSGEWCSATPAEMDAIRNDPRYYQAGRQMVIHSMSRGVFTEDILTFLRCDYLAVLRLPDKIALSPDDLKEDRSLIKKLPDDAEAVHASLMKGGDVTKDDVFKIARLSALGKIGSCYDFQFNDMKTANRFSCSEFVYYCYKSIHCYLGLEPKPHGLLKNLIFRRITISPADIYDAAVNTKKLEIVWKSCSLQKG